MLSVRALAGADVRFDSQNTEKKKKATYLLMLTPRLEIVRRGREGMES